MLFNKLCPACGKHSNHSQIHRSFVEKHFTHKEWNKLECCECHSEVFAHRYKNIDIKVSKRNKMVVTKLAF